MKNGIGILRIMIVALMTIVSISNIAVAIADNHSDNNKPTVIIAFDDGWRSVLDNAFPIMQSHNQKGVEFIITNQPDLAWNGLSNNYMNRSQLQLLYDAGWDLSSHTNSHINMVAVNDTVLNYELRTSRDWLNTNFPRGSTIMAYPNGVYNQHIIDTLILNHYVAARTVDPDSNYSISSSSNIFALGAYVTLGGPKGRHDNDSIVINQINNTISKNGTLILVFHKIVNSMSIKANDETTEFLTSDFRNVSNYLYDRRSEIDVRTLSDYLGITPLPRYIPPVPTNMISIVGVNWINVSWNPGIGNNTDIYNIYENGVRINDSVDPFVNITVVPGNSINISVYAVNTTYGNFVSTTPAHLNDTIIGPKNVPGFETISVFVTISTIYIFMGKISRRKSHK